MTGSSGYTPVPGDHTEGSAGAGSLSAPDGVLQTLLASCCRAARPLRREPLHVWQMSAVERIHLDDGTSVILKTAKVPFTAEADVLRHVAVHGVPVPKVLASHRVGDQPLVMLLEDLGQQPEEDPPLAVGARAAVAVHACPPLLDLPVLDAEALARLPLQALDTLATLNDQDRWRDTPDVRLTLEQIAKIAPRRARGTVTPPYGMCHSEFHPLSFIPSGDAAVIVDWARAFTGPGLLDLASWEDTPKPLDPTAIAAMLDAYVTAGGSPSARQPRGGLPPQVWAGGWHRVWIVEWYLQQCAHWMPDPASDEATQRTVRRHLREAARCLT